MDPYKETKMNQKKKSVKPVVNNPSENLFSVLFCFFEMRLSHWSSVCYLGERLTDQQTSGVCLSLPLQQLLPQEAGEMHWQGLRFSADAETAGIGDSQERD